MLLFLNFCLFTCYNFSLCVRVPAGVFAFGLFATDIFVNAGQVVTGGLSPYFLSVCKPNYTGTECRFNHQFIVNGNICTGNPIIVENARRSFPSKDASLSVYSAVYLTVRGSNAWERMSIFESRFQLVQYWCFGSECRLIRPTISKRRYVTGWKWDSEISFLTKWTFKVSVVLWVSFNHQGEKKKNFTFW